MQLGTSILRAVVGGLFVGHGTQKLFGWFGGHGPDATGQAFESMGLAPGKRHALAAGTAEAAGGALLAAGVLRPVAASALTGTMVTAIRKVHGSKGPWNTEGGWEYNVVLIAALFAAVEAEDGPAAAIAQLAAGAAGSFLATQPPFTVAPQPADAQPDVSADPAPVADEERFQREGRPAEQSA
ncbi:DoxX family protein [Conexibacter sp. SYSU D00693]|uniref:DoxX family protein n=1 Tax=Conexibacter sp. SYSU D00693 TaxID=2812560 RepID=UPI00196B258B|nr:DoxX family protein [Conexibacter sp. SYSU D00693]